MDHPKVFLTLTAIGRLAEHSCRLEHNRNRYIPPPTPTPPTTPTSLRIVHRLPLTPDSLPLRSLEASHRQEHNNRRIPPPTPSASRHTPYQLQLTLDSPPEHGDDRYIPPPTPSSSRLAPHRLQLTLDPSSSQSPKDTQLGFVFGTDEECCDVLLLGVEGISKRHFCVTFDKKRRVVLRDISDYGTRVSYGGQGEAQLRRNFTWILFDNLDDIQVILGPNDNYKIRFKVELELHNDCNDTYCKVKYHDNIDDYILNLGSTDSIYYRVKEIGKGGFAIVNEVLDVSTGLTLAGKLLSVTRGKEMEKRRADTIKDMVKNEVDIMKKISHASSLIPRLDISCEYLTDPKDHIVQFVDYTESPSPLLVMEYVKGGRLGNPYNLSRKNMITVLDQILRALQYLHDDMNLAHRDIKPNNILIASRSPFWVKLADFGLAVDADKLKGFCGTRIYAAPEVYTDRTYTTAVDIWSLGVIVYEHLFGLPGLKPKQNWTRWCRDLTDNVEWSLLNDSLVEFLGSAMLLVEPGERKSARGCLDMVDGLGNSSRLSLTSSGWLGGTDS